MFKVIKEFVPTPMFLMMCDHRTCAATATMPANLTNADDTRISQSTFLKKSGNEGWAIGLDAQLCPGHAELAKMQKEEAEARGRQMVEAADPMATVRYGKPLSIIVP